MAEQTETQKKAEETLRQDQEIREELAENQGNMVETLRKLRQQESETSTD